jgi:hypothetical protein
MALRVQTTRPLYWRRSACNTNGERQVAQAAGGVGSGGGALPVSGAEGPQYRMAWLPANFGRANSCRRVAAACSGRVSELRAYQLLRLSSKCVGRQTLRVP